MLPPTWHHILGRAPWCCRQQLPPASSLHLTAAPNEHSDTGESRSFPSLACADAGFKAGTEQGKKQRDVSTKASSPSTTRSTSACRAAPQPSFPSCLHHQGAQGCQQRSSQGSGWVSITLWTTRTHLPTKAVQRAPWGIAIGHCCL